MWLKCNKYLLFDKIIIFYLIYLFFFLLSIYVSFHLKAFILETTFLNCHSQQDKNTLNTFS